MKDKKEIEAIYNQDLPKLLKNLGIADAFNDGKIYCMYCGEVITLENIGAILTLKGEVNFCCSDLLCLSNTESDATE